mmetsp:Transcript_20103/g.42664  ORF Transcript_20103/g.42664 Transcript_20103/m.42664 type:complete len:118 (-) Transcript_20103:94-447(-)
MYYNFTGGLQEMAPPVSVTSEPVKVESDTSVAYDAQELATQIVGAHKRIDALIDELDGASLDEDEQIGTIMDLQAKHETLKATCKEERGRHGEVFDTLQDSYAVLADSFLKAPVTRD